MNQFLKVRCGSLCRLREREAREIANAGRVAASKSGPDDALDGELFDWP
ncbi:hypothetical protein HED55_05120 [Ochrobactrum haematophilum]|uniref:Uncharacterized protein n=1 Tax=Brucella haematophila TaxID=419474 RepID=A0ABX1DMY5_9HYPH|nr:hypothetical protein [Brucella haematophila]